MLNFFGTGGATFDKIVFSNPIPTAPLTFAFGALALGGLMLRNRRRGSASA